MKIRQDFVTNSSSSSFLICKKNLDEEQIEAIRNNYEMGKRLNIQWTDGSWDIEENDLFITGYTMMDNYYIGTLFEMIGINGANVTWGEYRFDINNDTQKETEQPRQNNEKWRSILADIKNGVPYSAEKNDELDNLIEGLED